MIASKPKFGRKSQDDADDSFEKCSIIDEFASVVGVFYSKIRKENL